MKLPKRFGFLGCFLLLFACDSAIAAENKIFKAEAAEVVGGASKVADAAASGGYLVGLAKPGQALKLPASSQSHRPERSGRRKNRHSD
jgi:hypothetical protein